MNAEAYIDAVRLLDCCVCGAMPVNAHHVIGGSMLEQLGVRGSRKHSDWLTIPLCHTHHQGTEGLHAIGVLTWEKRYGTQVEFVTRTGLRLGADPWGRERIEQVPIRHQYKPSGKIVPRRVQ